ncbi:MAG TPA: NAD(P)H-hydrate epimerase, partial [Myxococcota bacterium]
MGIVVVRSPLLRAQQAQARDRFSIDVAGIPGRVLMEHAGRAVADVADEALAAIATSADRVVVVCGRGNNGGDGFVAARHLLTRGRDVVVVVI